MATTITLNSSGSNLTSSGGAQKHMHYGFYKNNETTSSNSLYSRGDDDDDDDAFYDAYETNPSWTPPVSPSYLINNERSSSIPKQFHLDKLCPIDDQPKLEGASIQSSIGSSDASSPEYSPSNTSPPLSSQQQQQQQSSSELKSNTLQVNNNSNNNNNSNSKNTLKAKRNSRVISLIKNKKEELHNLFHRDGKEKEQQVPSISNTSSNNNNLANPSTTNQPISVVALNQSNEENTINVPNSSNISDTTSSCSNLNNINSNTTNNESAGSLRKLIKKKLTSMNLLDGENNSSPPSSLSSSTEISNVNNNNLNSNSNNNSFTEKQDSRVTRWLKNHNLKKKKELTSKFVLCSSIQAHKGSIWALEVCKDENHIATGGSDGVIRIWKIIKSTTPGLSSSNPIMSNTSSSALSDTVSNGSSNSNMSGGSNNLGHVEQPKILENTPRVLLEGHNGHILELKWINQQLLLSSSIDKTVKLWNIESGECIKTFEHNDIVVSISFDFVNNSLSHFYSATLDGIVRKWSIDNSESPVDSIELGEFITTISLSSNPYYLIVSTHLGNLVFFNPTNLELLHKFNVSQNHHNIKRGKGPKILGMSVVSSSLNSNCEYLLVSSNDSFVRQFSLKDFKRICKYTGMMLENYQVKPIVSPDKKSVIMGSEDNNIYIYDNYSEQQPTDEIRGSAGNKIIVENYEYFTASHKPITNNVFVTINSMNYLISTDSLGQIMIFNK
ncbi:hypothetical protein CYY_007194 [Polysphondylium violaceum]|uniref:Vps41 beta-propeller domain-containing protein n=1 Tax=Polysphondylium violaceum TaxID=133409 RepID=A0A8J4PPJ4_9MYCE|nr:hypothetical protein CYY_007194 [Polysphondylium violaceum]